MAPPAGQRIGAVLGGLLWVAGFGGCVSEEVRPRAPSEQIVLTVLRTEDRVQLSWPTKKGRLYTVLYADSLNPGSVWAPLAKAQNLVGTGEMLVVEDQVPEVISRSYRLYYGPYPPGVPVRKARK